VRLDVDVLGPRAPHPYSRQQSLAAALAEAALADDGDDADVLAAVSGYRACLSAESSLSFDPGTGPTPSSSGSSIGSNVHAAAACAADGDAGTA
jgi:hypothetical protein